MKTKKYRIILISILLIMLTLPITGCGKMRLSKNQKYDIQTVKPVIEKKLADKYGKEFTVLNLEEKRDSGVIYNYYFSGLAKTNDNAMSFEFGIREDGSNLEDNYEGFLNDEKIKDDLKRISESTSFGCEKFEVRYSLSGERYRTFEAYRKSQNAVLMADYVIDDMSDETAAEAVSSFVEQLQNAGYGFSLKFKWNGKTVPLYQDDQSIAITKETIMNKFRK